MRRRALVVGIDSYQQCPLAGCVNDAILLQRNGDFEKSVNFDVRKESVVSKDDLIREIQSLYANPCDVAIFYFSWYGYFNSLGGYIITPEIFQYNLGIAMNDILTLANDSPCHNKIIILDCCYAGAMGVSGITGSNTNIGEGVTILTSCRSSESALEICGHGVFTNLLIAALMGGAADLRGNITLGSVYSFIDRALGTWDQRPIFKTNVSEFIPIRKIEPIINNSYFIKITELFPEQKSEMRLDPSFEFTNNPDYKSTTVEPYADEINVKNFKILQKLASAGLVEPVGEEHMYFAAMNSKACKLTPLGQHYWNLVANSRI